MFHHILFGSMQDNERLQQTFELKKQDIVTSTGQVPTSITTAPGFNQLLRTRLGTPAAATTMSASLVISSGLSVKTCTTLTVAWCLCKHFKQLEINKKAKA